MQVRNITVKNPSGLHMRPAGVFANTIMPFRSDVIFSIRNGEYNGKSMISILSAAVKCGDEIKLMINGADEQACMDSAITAIEGGLGE